jgi:hypothetical protein
MEVFTAEYVLVARLSVSHRDVEGTILIAVRIDLPHEEIPPDGQPALSQGDLRSMDREQEIKSQTPSGEGSRKRSPHFLMRMQPAIQIVCRTGAVMENRRRNGQMDPNSRCLTEAGDDPRNKEEQRRAGERDRRFHS